MRVAVAATAGAVAAAIALLLTLGEWSSPWLIALAWIAAIAAAGSLIRFGNLIFPCSLAALGLLALLEVLEGAVPRSLTPLIGGALLAAGELGYWSFELRAVRQTSMGVTRRGAVILGLVLLGASISGVAVAVFDRLTAGST